MYFLRELFQSMSSKFIGHNFFVIFEDALLAYRVTGFSIVLSAGDFG